jgi:hypothetical protein
MISFVLSMDHVLLITIVSVTLVTFINDSGTVRLFVPMLEVEVNF